MNIEILYEDQDLLALLKPAGVVVNRADTVNEETLQDWLTERFSATPPLAKDEWQSLIPADFNPEFGQPEEIFKERVGIAHRLDKETSGVLLVGKNPGALVNLLHQFKQRLTQKKYLCLVHGKFAVQKDVISLPIGRASQNRLMFAVQADGREAVTEYEVKEFYPHLNLEKIIKLPTAAGSNIKKKSQIYQGFSLVECWPKTGRTHQIRVHFAHLKHPLVGDAVYAGKKRQTLDAAWCPRHFLHASAITFNHPRHLQSQTVEAPLPFDLQDVLEMLLQ